MDSKEILLKIINDSRMLHDLLIEEKESLVANDVDRLKKITKSKAKMASSIETSFLLLKNPEDFNNNDDLKLTLIKITDKNMELSNINNSIIGQLLAHNRDLISVLTNSKPSDVGYGESGKVNPKAIPTNIGKA